MLQTAVLENGADLGIALDGDGDRVVMVDHKCEVVDGDELLFIIARARHKAKTLNGAVVGTLMSNLGLEHALQGLGVELHRVALIDRLVVAGVYYWIRVLHGHQQGVHAHAAVD